MILKANYSKKTKRLKDEDSSENEELNYPKLSVRQ